jgi:PAS domain S-box-containing protein
MAGTVTALALLAGWRVVRLAPFGGDVAGPALALVILLPVLVAVAWTVGRRRRTRVARRGAAAARARTGGVLTPPDLRAVEIAAPPAPHAPAGRADEARPPGEVAGPPDLEHARRAADALPGMVLYVGADHRCRFANRPLERWFGASRGALAGRHLRDVLGEPAYEATRPHLEAALAGRRAECEIPLPHAGGQREVSVTCAPDAGEGDAVRGAVALVLDVTARKLAERERADLLDRVLLAGIEAQANAERLRRLQAVTDVALAQPEGTELSQALLAGIRAAVDADTATVLARDSLADELIVLATDGLHRDLPAGVRVPVGEGVVGAVAARRERVMRESSAPAAPGHAGAASRARVELGVPVMLGEELLGVLHVDTDDPRGFTGEHLGLLRLAADRVALVLQQRRLYHAEREARAAAEAQSRAKSEWIAMLSHEVRSPLAAIQTAAAALEGVAAHETGAERLRGVIARQVQHLARLTDDLLDVSRLETGRLALDRRPVDLRQVVQRALGSLRDAGRLGARHIEVGLAAAWVDGDPMRLEQVVVNLIDNAVKHTLPGRRIQVSVEVEDAEAVLRVADEGEGIPPELMSRIFEPFFQGPQTLARAHGGLGLGLTLVRRLVELHGGTVQVSSPGRGQGTEFVVRLARLAERPAQPGPVPTAVPHGRGLRVLVVEDSADARFALRSLLERWGHQVEEAADGAGGLEAAGRSRPDAILIDLGLPGMDGVEMAEAIRAAPGAGRARLVALTGHGRAEDRRRAEDAGFDAYLLKPANPEELRRILDSIPDHRTAEHPAGAAHPGPGEPGRAADGGRAPDAPADRPAPRP